MAQVKRNAMPRTATAVKTQRPSIYRYTTEDVERIALDAIKKHRLVFVREIFPFIPISHATFYTRGLDKSERIRDALEANQLDTKRGLRERWRDGENASTQIALYRLLGTEEEASRLSGSASIQTHIRQQQTINVGHQLSQRELALRFVVEAMAQGHTLEEATEALRVLQLADVPEPVRHEVAGYLVEVNPSGDDDNDDLTDYHDADLAG